MFPKFLGFLIFRIRDDLNTNRTNDFIRYFKQCSTKSNIEAHNSANGSNETAQLLSYEWSVLLCKVMNTNFEIVFIQIK